MTTALTDCEVCNTYSQARLLVIGRAIVKHHKLARSRAVGRREVAVRIDMDQLRERLAAFLAGVHARHTGGLSIEYPPLYRYTLNVVDPSGDPVETGRVIAAHLGGER